jgi:hypothetical protein
VLDYAESPRTDAEIVAAIDAAGYKRVAHIVTQSGSGKGADTVWVA